MFGRLGTTELLIILGIILIIFGPSKLPEIGKSIGKGIREFKSASKDLKDSINVDIDDTSNEGQAAPKKPEPVEAKPVEAKPAEAAPAEANPEE